MSKRDDFFAALTAGARWDVGVSIKRANPLPLDDKSVFESYAKLEEYAAGVLAYPGQLVAVVNEASTDIYYLDQNLTIKPVGVIPTGDGKSIAVTDGVISILGADEAEGLALPRMKADKSGIEWVPVSSVVEGDTNTITNGDNVTIITIADEESGNLIASLKGQDEATASSVLRKQADGTFAWEEVYNKDEVDGLVSGAFHFKGIADHLGEDGNLYKLPVTDEGEAEGSLITGKQGDVWQVTVSYDNGSTADIEYVYVVNEDQTAEWVELGSICDLSAYATTAAVTNAIASAKTDLQTYADNAEADANAYTDQKITDLGIGNYATTEELNNAVAALEAKDDEQDGLISNLDTAVKDAQADATQGITDAANAKTAADNAKTAADTAQGTADAAKNLATELNVTVNGDDTETGLVSKVSTNTSDIANIKTRLTTAEGDIETLEVEVGKKAAQTALDTATANITTLTERVTANEGAIATANGNITTLINNHAADKATLEAADTALGERIDGVKATADAADSLSKELNTAINGDNGIASKVAANTQAIADEAGRAAAAEKVNSDAIGALDTRVGTTETNIGELQETIKGLSGAMHFKGVEDNIPEDVSGYAEGDVIIVGELEYVFNGTEFAEFGDATANASAISALTEDLADEIARAKAAEEVNAAAAQAAQTDATQALADAATAKGAADAAQATADSAIKSVNVEAESGLAATTDEDNNVTIGFDPNVVFVFNGGTATSEW